MAVFVLSILIWPTLLCYVVSSSSSMLVTRVIWLPCRVPGKRYRTWAIPSSNWDYTLWLAFVSPQKFSSMSFHCATAARVLARCHGFPLMFSWLPDDHVILWLFGSLLLLCSTISLINARGWIIPLVFVCSYLLPPLRLWKPLHLVLAGKPNDLFISALQIPASTMRKHGPP